MSNLTKVMAANSRRELEKELIALVDDCVSANPFRHPHNLTRICQVEKYLPEFSNELQSKAKKDASFSDAEVNMWHEHAKSVAAKAMDDGADEDDGADDGEGEGGGEGDARGGWDVRADVLNGHC